MTATTSTDQLVSLRCKSVFLQLPYMATPAVLARVLKSGGKITENVDDADVFVVSHVSAPHILHILEKRLRMGHDFLDPATLLAIHPNRPLAGFHFFARNLGEALRGMLKRLGATLESSLSDPGRVIHLDTPLLDCRAQPRSWLGSALHRRIILRDTFISDLYSKVRRGSYESLPLPQDYRLSPSPPPPFPSSSLFREYRFWIDGGLGSLPKPLQESLVARNAALTELATDADVVVKGSLAENEVLSLRLHANQAFITQECLTAYFEAGPHQVCPSHHRTDFPSDNFRLPPSLHPDYKTELQLFKARFTLGLGKQRTRPFDSSKLVLRQEGNPCEQDSEQSDSEIGAGPAYHSPIHTNLCNDNYFQEEQYEEDAHGQYEEAPQMDYHHQQQQQQRQLTCSGFRWDYKLLYSIFMEVLGKLGFSSSSYITVPEGGYIYRLQLLADRNDNNSSLRFKAELLFSTLLEEKLALPLLISTPDPEPGLPQLKKSIAFYSFGFNASSLALVGHVEEASGWIEVSLFAIMGICEGMGAPLPQLVVPHYIRIDGEIEGLFELMSIAPQLVPAVASWRFKNSILNDQQSADTWSLFTLSPVSSPSENAGTHVSVCENWRRGEPRSVEEIQLSQLPSHLNNLLTAYKETFFAPRRLTPLPFLCSICKKNGSHLPTSPLNLISIECSQSNMGRLAEKCVICHTIPTRGKDRPLYVSPSIGGKSPAPVYNYASLNSKKVKLQQNTL